MEAIRIDHVWKTYKRGKIKRSDLRQSIRFWWQEMWHPTEEFHALQDINCRIEKGEVIGILGPNGAGKSTLLKLLSRITSPTQGRISITGSLSSLLEVGIGFHPELTGRENIFLNGVIHGMSRKEIDRKIDQIIDFSGLELYLDTPVKQYSSGMYVRLAFSVSAHLDSDILLLDEVLGVGDLEFKKKSLQKLHETVRDGRTIIMVSHQLDILQSLCTKGIYLEAGQIKATGPINEVIDLYLKSHTDVFQFNIADRKDREGTGVAKIKTLEFINASGETLPHIISGQLVIIRIHLDSQRAILNNVEIRLDIFDQMGQQWFVLSNNVSDGMISQCNGTAAFECVIPKFPLAEGSYYLSASLNVEKQRSDAVQNALRFDVVPGVFYPTGRTPDSSKGVLVDYHWKVSS